jgi:hypothetical protein
MSVRPELLLMIGLPGSGKTTAARRLAEERRILRLTPDEWMGPLFQDGEADRRARAGRRWREHPGSTFPMTGADHDQFLLQFQPPTAAELACEPMPPPPSGSGSWHQWASERWPTLPRLDLP